MIYLFSDWLIFVFFSQYNFSFSFIRNHNDVSYDKNGEQINVVWTSLELASWTHRNNCSELVCTILSIIDLFHISTWIFSDRGTAPATIDRYHCIIYIKEICTSSQIQDLVFL